MAQWAHGYNVEVPYTLGYYKETSPIWVKWAVLIGGRKPPQDRNLRVLELGCGFGYNLCIHAACFPMMEFLGIDFNPAHVFHGNELARIGGLKNIRFEEGDFVELAKEWPSRYGQFHYVILHGVWTWIAKPVREAAVEILKKALLPGGIVYNSYNAMPGWMVGTLLRALLKNYQEVTGLPGIEAVRKGLDLAKKMADIPAPVFNVYPALKNRIEMASKHNLNYVVHEYLNDAHTVFWVHEVIEEMLEGKCYYAGSANLVENFLPGLLPDPLEKVVNEFSNMHFRLFLIDFMINQAFRRDIYQKGIVNPWPIEQLRELKSMAFIRLGNPREEELVFSTTAGQIKGRKEIYEPILEELSTGIKTVGEIVENKKLKEQGIKLPGVIQYLTLLLDKGLIALYNETFNIPYAVNLSRTIARLATEGRPYNFLPAPVTGVGVNVPPVEMMILDALYDGQVSNMDMLVDKSLARLKNLGRTLVKDDKPIEDPAEERAYMGEIAQKFVAGRIPELKKLGVVI